MRKASVVYLAFAFLGLIRIASFSGADASKLSLTSLVCASLVVILASGVFVYTLHYPAEEE